MLWQWLIINIDSVSGLLHLVDVGYVVSVVEILAARVVRFEVCRVVSFIVYIELFWKGWEEGGHIEGGDWCLFWASRDTASVEFADEHLNGSLLENTVASGILYALQGPEKGRLHNFIGPLSLLAQTRHQSPFISPTSPYFSKHNATSTQKLTNLYTLTLNTEVACICQQHNPQHSPHPHTVYKPTSVNIKYIYAIFSGRSRSSRVQTACTPV
jgi:hypothetical protein